ncbi:hypothetical protein HYALB_00011390 [Hymenoscyphus albidus]|uniref:Helicase ATP-binding domain-containing protein n=1 Tax=Hymenoscyphus albidus TaxID=595503 RepID=A0A9N9LJF2_9HELO|nr:hypothetical protein HYALB_00011390 [Hymenoscyphus albidus]
MQLHDLENKLEVGKQRTTVIDEKGQFQKTINEVYASLARGNHLNQVQGDERLETQLLPHQQEALDLMSQREDGPVSPEYCLWKSMGDADKGWYRHDITKLKTRINHPETGGGILADEMRVGKSLSILALVTQTLDESLRWAHNLPVDDGEALPQTTKRSRATLILVPHLKVKLNVLKYHGRDRKSLLSKMDEADIVLTTYHTIVWETEKRSSSGKNRKPNPMQSIEWFRIVLDEAHIIRRQKTTFNSSVSKSKSRSRWCLTGTPIQNKLDDIGALFPFLKVRTFDNITTFRRYVGSPFNDCESNERRPLAIRHLTLLMDSMCLRRSRNLLHLPEPQNRIHVVQFSDEERDQYEYTKKIMKRALQQRVNEENQNGLRILCNHGTYQHSFSWTNKRNLMDEREDALCSMGNSGEVKCSVCKQCMPIMTKSSFQTYPGICAHVLCFECAEDNNQLMRAQGFELSGCPICAISGAPNNGCGPNANTNTRRENYLRNIGVSSKINALIRDIQVDLWETKSIVFSCWTNTLDLIEKHLHECNITFQRIDGDVNFSRRQRILDEFSSSDSKTPVLIMTTGTGAFGYCPREVMLKKDTNMLSSLNLPSANRVFIIEPQWNPSVENQAISRAIRLNQKISVVVTRSQQETKIEIADIGVNATVQMDTEMLYPGYGISHI